MKKARSIIRENCSIYRKNKSNISAWRIAAVPGAVKTSLLPRQALMRQAKRGSAWRGKDFAITAPGTDAPG